MQLQLSAALLLVPVHSLGPIPTEFGQLVQLRSLMLYSNRLTGQSVFLYACPLPPQIYCTVLLSDMCSNDVVRMALCLIARANTE